MLLVEGRNFLSCLSAPTPVAPRLAACGLRHRRSLSPLRRRSLTSMSLSHHDSGISCSDLKASSRRRTSQHGGPQAHGLACDLFDADGHALHLPRPLPYYALLLRHVGRRTRVPLPRTRHQQLHVSPCRHCTSTRQLPGRHAWAGSCWTQVW